MLLVAYNVYEYHKVKSLIDRLKLEKIQFKELIIGRNLSIYDISPNDKDNLILNVIDQIDSNNQLKDITNVLICGDSIDILGVTMAAFNRSIPVIHLGAGYRTYDPTFPNEIYRQAISRFVSINLCSSIHNAKNLTSEGIRSTKYIVGNPTLDLFGTLTHTTDGPVLILLVDDIWAEPLRTIKFEFTNIKFEYSINNFPIETIKRANYIISPKTEIQEIACYLHKPMIILGKVTDRPESLWYNVTRCANPDYLPTAFKKCLEKSLQPDYECPYGSGDSTNKIIEILKKEIKC